MDEKIKAMNEAATLAPTRLQEVLAGAADLRQAGATLAASCKEKQTAAATLLEQVEQALEQLREQGAGHESRLVEDLAQVHERFAALTAALDEAATKVGEVRVEAEGDMKALGEAVRAGTGAVIQEGQQAAEELGLAHASLQQSWETMSEALENAQSDVEELRSSLSEQAGESAENVDKLNENLSQAREQMNARLEELGEAFSELKTTLSERLEELTTGGLTPSADQIGEKAQTAIKGELTELLQGAVEQLTKAVGGMSEISRDSGGEAGEIRQLVEPIVDELKVVVEPIGEAIEEIKRVADSLGVF